MARGKKSSPELIYKIMASYALTQSHSETARILGVSATTVKGIVDANKDKPEFVRLQGEKKEEFAKQATEIIEKGLLLLNRRFDRALASENELDALIEMVLESEKKEISSEEKARLIAKLKTFKVDDVKSITTAIGTLFDKRALSSGSATEVVEIKLPPGVEEYAG